MVNLKELFSDVCLDVRGIRLLRSEDAIRFVRICRDENVPILGIDGFRLFDGKRIQPFQEHSSDYSDQPEESHDLAEAFLLERMDKDLWFEMYPDVPLSEL